MKDTYLVSDAPFHQRNREDASFKMCLCTMLLLLAMFIIILLGLWALPKDTNRISRGTQSDSWGGKVDKSTASPITRASTTSQKPTSPLTSSEKKASTKTLADPTSTTVTLHKSDKSFIKYKPRLTTSTTEASKILIEMLSTDGKTTEESDQTLFFSSSMEEEAVTGKTSEEPESTLSSEEIEFPSTTTNYFSESFTEIDHSKPDSDDLKDGTPTVELFTEKEELTDESSEASTGPSLENTTAYSITEKISEKMYGEFNSTLSYTDGSSVGTTVDTSASSLDSTVSSGDSMISSIGTTVSSCPACPLECPTSPTTVEPTAKPDKDVCLSQQCYMVASRMLSLVNAISDPCDNFYSYACGGMVDNPSLLEEDLSRDIWNRIHETILSDKIHSPYHQMVKDFYDGCINYDKLVPTKHRKTEGLQLLENVAMFHNDSRVDPVVFVNITIGHILLGSSPLLRIWLDVDLEHSSQFQVVMGPPDSFGSQVLGDNAESERCRRKADDVIPHNLQEAFTQYQECKDNISYYLKTTKEALDFFGVFDDLNESDSSNLIQETMMSVEIMLELLKESFGNGGIGLDIKHKIETKKKFKVKYLHDLETDIPQINWRTVLDTLLKRHVNDSDTVQFYFYDEVKSFFDELQNRIQEPNKVVNSLLAMLAHDLYGIALSSDSCDREQFCVQAVAKLMPLAATNLYLSSFTEKNEQLYRQATDVYSQLVDGMTVKVETADWLDNMTRDMVLEKLNSSKMELPKKFDDILVENSLEECNITKNYMIDAVCLLQQLKNNELLRFHETPQSSIWPHYSTAYSTHTAFIYPLNTLMVPLAAVAPIFDSKMPKHVVLARLGNVLARGIAHNFDWTGIKFAADGRFGNILSEEANPSFTSAVDNANNQYYYDSTLKEGNVIYSYKLVAARTLNQRLSDITAANLTLSVLHETHSDTKLPWVPFTAHQVYFLSLAQTFCTKKKMPELFTSLYEDTSLLPSVRVSNLASNSHQFSKAFHCKLGSNMNPTVKASPFPHYEKMDPSSDLYSYYAE